MNVLFLFLFSVSCILLLFSAPEKILTAALAGAEKAVALCASLAAVYCVWMGVTELLTKAGAHRKLSKLFSPLLGFLFGDLPDQTAEFITLNLSSNLLGLGSVATPAGVEGAKRMESVYHAAPTAAARLRYERQTTALFLLNTCMLQLLPTSVISLRASLGSESPSDTVLSSLLSGAVSLSLAILTVRLHKRYCEKKETLLASKPNAGNEPTAPKPSPDTPNQTKRSPIPNAPRKPSSPSANFDAPRKPSSPSAIPDAPCKPSSPSANSDAPRKPSSPSANSDAPRERPTPHRNDPTANGRENP